QDVSDDAFAFGDVIRIDAPSVLLTAQQTRLRTFWPTGTQLFVTLIASNRYGQKTKVVDDERNVREFFYNASFAPDGGAPVPGTTQTDTTGGYLNKEVEDTTNDPRRDTGTNPAPTSLTRQYFYDTNGNVVAF